MDKLQEVVQKDCIYCGAQVGEHIGTREVRWKGELYLIEQIPIGVCNECGERFLSGIASSSLGSRHRRLHSLLPSTADWELSELDPLPRPVIVDVKGKITR